MPRPNRSAAGAVLVGLFLLVAAAGLFAWSRSGVTYSYDGYGISRLLDRLLADLNAKDEASIAALATGEGLAKSGPPSGRAMDPARSWSIGYGGLGLHDGQYRWRRDLDDGMSTQIQVTATTAAGDPVAVWLTVRGSVIDLSNSNDLASVISGPEQDARIGAALLTIVPASDGDGHVTQVWIATMGWAGAVTLVLGVAVGVRRGGTSRTGT